ncbi:cytochrome P450 [Saccharomonospora cyanea]|uniref:Cytochrome P450 n=1 Tax=Saccharomonospora cyanea NA-134 TaxID=882082 RepID=H5XLK9_9PSEU|nr:cytochrome P450 [Saccharomonospora cyanea]EHR59878.1 cytochrome P450 [Saccharomonospora cyanea NA-134]
MNRTELRMALRTLPFLDAHRTDPARHVRLADDPPKLLVWEPETIGWLFGSDPELDHPGSRSLKPLFGDHSLLWVDGPRHAAYRKLLGPPLRGRRLAAYTPLVADTVHEAVDALRVGQTVALADWTRHVALRVIARLVLGDVDDRTGEVLDDFTTWIDDALGSRPRTLAHRFLRGGLPRSGPELDARLVEWARSGRGHEPPTLGSLLLDAEGPLAGLGGGDSDDLRDQLVSLLFAGHETTASAAAWTLYWLARDESLRRDVLAELDATTDDAPAASAVPLLTAVISEALRLAPPVTVAENRRLRGPARLLGRTLPAGTTLTTSIYLAHRQDDTFARPLRFDPTRFLDHKFSPAHYLPFGGGSRRCLGSQLAMLELRLITATVLRRREWRLVNPSAGRLQLRGHAMAPSSRLRMRVTACRD